MAQGSTPVKENPQGHRENRTLAHRCLDFIEKHPRTGWYIAVMATLNVLLNLLQLYLFH
jgi:hypothetical protein